MSLLHILKIKNTNFIRNFFTEAGDLALLSKQYQNSIFDNTYVHLLCTIIQ